MLELYDELQGNFPEAIDFALKTFEEVIKDYNTYYNVNTNAVYYSNESELEDILFDLYDIKNGLYEVDYDNERFIIPIFN